MTPGQGVADLPGSVWLFLPVVDDLGSVVAGPGGWRV